MIRINRIACPVILEKKSEVWQMELIAANTEKGKKLARGKYKHKQIKTALEEMCHRKCAYCESKLSHIAYGHIEHFRPFTLFESQCFVWGNLLLSCEICNGSKYKSSNFPLTTDGETIINPSEDDPAAHLNFEIDPATYLCYVGSTSERGRITEELLGLNRIELVRYRSDYVKKLVVLFKLSSNNAEARALFEEANSDKHEFLAFIRKIPEIF